MREPTAVHTVSFSGTGGDYPLAWAQLAMWRSLAELGDAERGLSNIPLGVETDEADSVPQVLEGIARLIERHEALRARVVTRADGQPHQEVADRGELTVKVYDTTPLVADQLREEVVADLSAAAFTDAELPLRAAVVTQRGNPRWVLFVLSHVALDGWSAGVVYDDFRRFLAKGTMESHPGGAPQALRDQVSYEASARGALRAERASAFVRGQLARFPNTVLPVRATAGERPRFRELSVESAAVADSTRTLADRHRVSTAAVLVGAYAVTVAELAGRDRLGFFLAAANRVTPEERRAVANYAQFVPVCVDVTECSFPEFLGRTMLTLAAAYRNGRYPVGVLDEAVRAVSRERGGWIDMSALLNLHLQAQGRYRDDDSILPAEGRRLARRRKTTFSWRDGQERAPMTLGLSVWSLTDVAHLSVWIDTTVISPDLAESLARTLEGVLTRAADDEEIDVAGLRARAALDGLAPDRSRLVDVDGFWADPEAVRALLVDVLDPDAVGVFVTDHEEGRSLTCFLTMKDRDVEPEEVRRSLLARGVPGRELAVVPRRIVVCATAPADPDSLDEWRRQPEKGTVS